MTTAIRMNFDDELAAVTEAHEMAQCPELRVWNEKAATKGFVSVRWDVCPCCGQDTKQDGHGFRRYTCRSCKQTFQL